MPNPDDLLDGHTGLVVKEGKLKSLRVGREHHSIFAIYLL